MPEGARSPWALLCDGRTGPWPPSSTGVRSLLAVTLFCFLESDCPLSCARKRGLLCPRVGPRASCLPWGWGWGWGGACAATSVSQQTQLLPGHSPAVTAPGPGPASWAPPSLAPPPVSAHAASYPARGPFAWISPSDPIPIHLPASLSPLPVGSPRWDLGLPLLLRELMTFMGWGWGERRQAAPWRTHSTVGSRGSWRAPGTELASGCLW